MYGKGKGVLFRILNCSLDFINIEH